MNNKLLFFIAILAIASNLIVSKELNKNTLVQKYSLDTVYIDLTAQSINSIDSAAFYGFKSLKILYLNDNKLNELNPGLFENLFQLQEIWLESNNIQSLNSNLFSGLNNLEKICLYDNPISKLQESSEINKLCGSNSKCSVKLNEKCTSDLFLLKQQESQDEKIDKLIGLVEKTLKKVDLIENTTIQLQNEQTNIVNFISVLNSFYDCDAGSPCRNDGECKSNGERYVCDCKEDYYGEHCEYKKSAKAINQNIRALYNSEILTNASIEDLFSLTNFKSKTWKLIYSGNRDGYESSKFHSMCDNIANTFSLVKTLDSYVFGGYTTQIWNSNQSVAKDENAFIVSLKNYLNEPVRLKTRNNEAIAIYKNPQCLPSFGRTDIRINDNANNVDINFCRSSDYVYLNGSNYDTNLLSGNENFVDGQNSFRVTALEVYTVKETSLKLDGSSILEPEMIPILLDLTKFGFDSWQLIYRASENGFRITDFHAKCNNVLNTFTLIKTTKSNVFGGYTKLSWDLFGSEKDEDAFLISLVNLKNDPARLNSRKGEDVIYGFESMFGPIFGSSQSNADIFITNMSNECTSSECFSTSTRTGLYLHLNGSEYEEDLLAGDRYFITEDIEVYAIKNS